MLQEAFKLPWRRQEGFCHGLKLDTGNGTYSALQGLRVFKGSPGHSSVQVRIDLVLSAV